MSINNVTRGHKTSSLTMTYWKIYDRNMLQQFFHRKIFLLLATTKRRKNNRMVITLKYKTML